MKAGKVSLVGAGPGDPGLLTRRGEQLIRQAEVVVYDRLVSDEILQLIPENARRINVGKTAGNHPVPQEEINRILLEEGLAGHRVVRLKGGDPFVFGRGGEELELLVQHGVAFEVVPGITSAVAAFADAGIPVTHRDYCSSFHVITGHARAGGQLSIDFEALVRMRGTLIFLMGVSALPQLMAGLLAAGMAPETPAAVVENGTRPYQRKVVADVGSLPRRAEEAGIHSPAIIAVGEVCRLSEQFDWFMGRPLFGCPVLVTRSGSHPGRLAPLLAEQGAEVVDLPVIETRPLEENPALDALLQSLDRPGWLLFSSQKAAEVLLDRLLESGKDLRALAGWRLGAVGPATARYLKERGLVADLVPETFDGLHLGKALPAEPGCRAVSLESTRSAGGAAPGASDGLHVERLPLYETVLLPLSEELCDKARALLNGPQKPLFSFSSASMAESLVASLPELRDAGYAALCIGEQTAKKAAALGFMPVTAPEATIESMARTAIEYLGKEVAAR